MFTQLKTAETMMENAAAYHREDLLNALTAAVTGQGDWATFKANMQAGYVPTIRERRPTKRMSRGQAVWVQAEQMLRIMVREEGFKVYDGTRVA